VNRHTLEILGSFVTGPKQEHTPGHKITTDKFGNIYITKADVTGADVAHNGGTGAYKFAFKGYAPRTPCCQSTRAADTSGMKQ